MTAKERPIIFNAEMVRALLDGRKTQTRRVAKLTDSGRVALGGHNWHLDDPDAVQACPYGQPGDRLWVRESFRVINGQTQPEIEIDYKATTPNGYRMGDFLGSPQPYKPSIHMPRRVSRILLEITNVRAGRVQEISEADAKSEGWPGSRLGHYTAYQWFWELWDSINAARGFGWDVNPWVWVVEFRKIS